MKLLARENPQALVSFFLKGGIYEGDMNPELIIPMIIADGLYHVKWNGESIVLHFEFQRSRKSNMPRRVWEYNALASIISEKPVYSVVLYPVKVKSVTKSVYRTRFRNGLVTQWFSFHQIKLWELPPEMFEQPESVGLLPLLPLTKNGQNRETVERMIRKMKQAGTWNENTLMLAKLATGLVLKTAEDKQWQKGMFDMLEDVLEESWVYQEIAEKERKEELCNMLIRLTTLRFPDLVGLAQKLAKQEKSSEQLRTMVDKLFTASTDQEARDVLIS